MKKIAEKIYDAIPQYIKQTVKMMLPDEHNVNPSGFLINTVQVIAEKRRN